MIIEEQKPAINNPEPTQTEIPAPELISLSNIEEDVAFIPVVDTVPTEAPKTFRDRLVRYVNGSTVRLYFWDNSAWQYTPVAPVSDSDLALPNVVCADFTAAEDIAAGDAVIMGDGTSSYNRILQSTNTSVLFTLNGVNVCGQTFTTGSRFKKLAAVTINFTAGGPGTIAASIRNVSGGLPTSVVGLSNNGSLGATTNNITLTFSPSLTLLPNTQYAVVFNASIVAQLNGSNTDSYAGGNFISSSGGLFGSWGADTGKDLYFSITEYDTVEGQISKADASIAGDLSNNFIGFASEAILAGTSGTVCMSGLATLSGLTTGSTYYLSDTPGAIATTTGTVSKKVGLATSSTHLLIKHDN